jgi:hypothetical protein
VQILIRGHLVATVRLHAASTTRRAVIVLPRFGVRGGRVTVRVVSTGRPVQIDGLGVTRA